MVCCQGEVVDYLGSSSSPWKVQVSLLSGGGGGAALAGTTMLTFVNGTASFTDLTIDLPAADMVLHFSVVEPAEASNYTLDTPPFQVRSHCSRSAFRSH